jgi:hypothetical protein
MSQRRWKRRKSFLQSTRMENMTYSGRVVETGEVCFAREECCFARGFEESAGCAHSTRICFGSGYFFCFARENCYLALGVGMFVPKKRTCFGDVCSDTCSYVPALDVCSHTAQTIMAKFAALSAL